MRRRKRTGCILGILMILLLFLGNGRPVSAEEKYDGGVRKVIYDHIGHYALNYTGNTNHYDYWNADGTTRVVSRNYKDRADIPSTNNSAAIISPTDTDSKIKYAFLLWQSRSEKAPTKSIGLVTPDGTMKNVFADKDKICQDTRMNVTGESYVGVYTMVADVTSIVCSEAGGYGAYTVANIPVWDGVQIGEVVCGGESVASWQLVVVEESPNFPLRTISLNTLSQYFYNINYTVSVNFADASAPNGEISAQFLDGSVDVDAAYRYDGIGYPDDYVYQYEGSFYRYYTQARGLYKNGICFNNRDTGGVKGGASAIGGIRVHLFDDYRRTNGQLSQSMTYMWAGKNMGINVFLYGVSIDVFAYDIVFDGNGATGGSMENLLNIYGRWYNLTENQYEKLYWKFTGWNTKPDGSGTSYKNREMIRNLTATEDKIVLYAQWEPDPYKITLDNENATSRGTDAYYEWYSIGNYSTVSCTTKIDKIIVPQKKGFAFHGYYTEKNGKGMKYVDSNGEILSTPTTFENDTTLYAYWTSGVYKITLDNQEADSPGTKQYYERFNVGNYTTAECTTEILQIELPAKEHYTFGGYYTEKNGEGKRIIDEVGNIIPVYTIFNQDTVIYAKWIPKTYIISLDNQEATNPGTDAYYEKYGEMSYVVLGIVDATSEKVVETFSYTGTEQIFIAPHTGTYELTLWGADGEPAPIDVYKGFSAMTTGKINLVKGEILYIYVGGAGGGSGEKVGGWNGGGNGAKIVQWSSMYLDVTAGGGATDIRRGGKSLEDRILVAGGNAGTTLLKMSDGSMVDSYYWNAPSILNKDFTSATARLNSIYSGNGYFDVETHRSMLTYNVTNQQTSCIYNVGDLIAEVYQSGTGVLGEVRVQVVHKGSFGKGKAGGGGGWYGGSHIRTMLYVGEVADRVPVSTSSAGSCYTDGVLDGKVWKVAQIKVDDKYEYVGQDLEKSNVYYKDYKGDIVIYDTNMHDGNGLATITYDNYLELEQAVATTIIIPQKDGYRFGGYYTGKDGHGTKFVDESGNILSTPITFEKNTTLYAHWISDTSNTYKIAFNGNGAETGTMSIMTCNFEQLYTLSANTFTKTGYVFAGWSTTQDGTVEYADKASVKNLATNSGEVVTLYAHWVAGIVSYEVNHYTESLMGDWEFHSTETRSGITGTDVRLSDLKKIISGFTYKHSEVKGIVSENATIISDGSLVVNLYYTRNFYTVTLNKDNGISSVSGAGTYKFEEEVLVAAEVLPNYKWDKWNGTLNSIDKECVFTMPAKNVTVTANSNPMVYTVYLDEQLASESGTLQYYEKYSIGNFADNTCNNCIKNIIIPKKVGSLFGGYYTEINGDGIQYIDANGKILSSATTFIQDTVLYAKWIPITYTIHFDGNGATGGSMSDMICSFDKTYQLNANQFIKEKYRFVGWNTEANGSGTSYMDRTYVEKLCIEQGDIITLYAQWTANTYIVHFDGNGGIGIMDDMECEFYVDYELSENRFIKTGYDFLGWSLVPDGEVVLVDKEVINNLHSTTGIITLYAQWTPDVVTYRVNHYTEGLDNEWILHETDDLTGYTETVLRLEEFVKNIEYFTYKNAKVDGTVVNEAAILADGSLIIDLYYTRNSYMVILDKDDGISSVNGAGLYKHGEKVVIEAAVQSGYMWKCWSGTYDSADIQYEFVMPTEDVTMKANTRLATYIIRFDGNGADEGSMSDMCCMFGQEYHLLPNGFTKSNEFGMSTFKGWSRDALDTAAVYEDEALVIDLPEGENDVITLYAVWDDCPWIIAENLYYSLYEAQNGLITYEELMRKAVAEDREDGAPLSPGIDPIKGTSFTIIDYLSTDFTQFTGNGSVTETYQVIDSAGNRYSKRITVHIVDTTPIEMLPDGRTRFINEEYYNKTYENGGLEEDSIWKTDPEFVAVIKKAFENLKNDTPIISFLFTYEEIIEMKEFIRTKGIGNSRNPFALQQFYDTFMIPNIENIKED